MARGTPDDNLQPFQSASQVTDLGTIYQMLWGFSPVNSQGRIFYLDTFNNGIGGWVLSKTGAGQVPSIFSGSGGVIYSPPNAVLLQPGTVAGDKSSMVRKYILSTTKIGMEATFLMRSDMPNPTLRIDYTIEPNVSGYAPEVRYNQSIGNWQIKVLGGAYQNITNNNLGASGANFEFIQVKIVGDWSIGKYVRVILGDTLIDLSSFSMPIGASLYRNYAEFTFETVANVIGTPEYLGYILLTKDEP